MSNQARDRYIALGAVVSLLLASPIFAQSTTKVNKLSAAEIVAMIPQSMDNISDPAEEKNRKQLVAMGEVAYPVLCAEMLKANNQTYYIGNIISVLIDSDGNKAIPRKALKDLAEELPSRSEEDAEGIRSIIARALGKIGTSDDTPILIGFLSGSSNIVRTQTLHSLEKIGTVKDLNAIQTWLTTRKASMSPRWLMADPSTSAAETAITEIQKREAEKISGAK